VSKNVAVFVDVANIFYAAKAAGVDIDYVTLLKSATAGRDFVRAYAYTGLDPDNENQRNFHQFLARNSYKVVSKDIRKYGDGRVKANLDIEMVVDMMKTARNLDVAVLVSGDGDFAPAIRAVQEMGVRVEVICFKANTSSDLIDVADQFIEITQIAKVEKGSGRSGRRVAGDEEDLSMTEVPEKQTEGATERRRRSRARSAEAAAAERTTTSRRRSGSGSATMTVLPGEKLARHEGGEGEENGHAAEAPDAETAATDARPDDDAEAGDGEQRRRRRRRRGRGRGRGAGTEGAAGEDAAGEDAATDDEEDGEPVGPPRAPRAAAFGSVWDSQIGVPSGPRTSGSEADEEELDEPEIPEYLLAERRGRSSGGRGRGTGRRDAYRSAIERERFGRGRGPAPRADRHDGGRPPRREPREGRAPRSAEGWSEVPPELEAMLRAQMQSRQPAPAAEAVGESTAAESTTAETPKRTSRSRKPTATTADGEEAPPKAAKPRTTRARKSPASAPTSGADAAEPATKPARTSRTRKAAAAPEEEVPAKPARRSRAKAAAAE
jgi:uncharacterized LabA/DUF88 family protein